MAAPTTFSVEAIEARLSGDLRHWRYRDGAIRRVFRTHGWKGTLMVVNAIAHLSEAAWHHPDLSVSYDKVEVALSSHDANGITDRDFALAAKVEQFVHWQPSLENGPLEGTPAEERHAYLRYDA